MATTAMAQEIICDMCEISPVQMHCNSCAANLCNDCLSKHISADTEKDHNMVIFRKKNTKPIFPCCKTHDDQNCKMKCQQCDTPVCVNCITLGAHKKHKLLGFLTLFNSQKDNIKQKTTELQTRTCPKYEKAVPLPIQGEQLHQMFGTLTAASMPHSLSSIKLVEYKLATAIKQLQLLDSPESPSSIHTAYQYGLHCITCLSPDQVWVGGRGDSKIKCFTVTGSLQETITTTTGNIPSGITVSRQRDLIYTDWDDRSINRVRHGKKEKIISLQQSWKPQRICCTDSDDLLVTMIKSFTPRRVVRYSGSTEKQVIQFDDQRKPLFSSGLYCNTLFIAENSNKDMICVSDSDAYTVVVLNQAGKLHFRYTGNLSSQKNKSFCPRGVAIDSMGHILVADGDNCCIHIIDQQGHFIHYIDNCQLREPWDLSLDRNYTLYVAEYNIDEVRVIKYLT